LTTKELSDNQVLEDLYSTFIMLEDEVKEGMLMNILSILKKIVTVNKNGKILTRLILATLQKTDISSDKHLDIAFLVCSGALKILITGDYQNSPITYTPVQSLFCELESDDVGELFQYSSNLLINHLNLGSFEGVAGAKKRVV
jgi:hypothetical protein